MKKIKLEEAKNTGEKKLLLFRLTNSSGNYVEILNLGATIVSVVVPDKTGQPRNVVLRYPCIESYVEDPFYLGATIGRVANRIKNATFRMNEKVYQLDKNDGGIHCNHGGYNGLNNKWFTPTIQNDSLVLTIDSPDGEGGFPGNVSVKVTYQFTDWNELVINYQAVTDQTTPVNLTNHAYFNLSDNTSILNHELQVYLDHYLEMEKDFIPTGKIKSVMGTSFDFTEYRAVRNGYNSYFMKNNTQTGLSTLACVRSKKSGISMKVKSTTPGILFYTGDYLSTPFTPSQGLCLEAQYAPDGLNQPALGKNILTPDQIYSEQIIYYFGNQ